MTSKTHGEGNPMTPRYRAWAHMLERCKNPWHPHYKNYGGRGIKVCDRWKHYEKFVEDMGPHPGKGWSIDRIDNNGAYEPTNCRWATTKMQRRNQRTTKLTFLQVADIRYRRLAGEASAALAKKFGVSQSLVCNIVANRKWA